MTIARRRMIVACLAALAAALGGCASSPDAPGDSATGGLVMTMFAELDEGAYVAYRVDPDGTLSFAGGADALDRKYTWSGPMTAEEIAALQALIEDNGWFDADPAPTYVPPQRTFEIWLGKAGQRRSARRFKVMGDGPGVSEVYDLLETAARRRHDAFLQTLPKPGQQKP